jgi:excisionase family DNA binding protein
LLSTAQPRYPDIVLTTTEVAAKAEVSRHTVEREIHRGHLEAKKLGNRWAIDEAEAERWATQFRLYAEQRDRDRTTPAD